MTTNPSHTMNPSSTSVAPRRSAPWHHDRLTVVLHWTLAALITALAALGWFMMAIEDDPGSRWYFDQHKSFGLVLALLVAVRIVWRAGPGTKPPPAGLPGWQDKLAKAVQGLLYLLMVLMPLSGYLGAAYSKSGVAWFGLATPRWAVPDHDRAEWFFDMHSVLIWVLAAAVVLHVLGALKHRLIDRDDVMQRMGWGSSPPPPR
jgi:cytochrome b561